MNLKLLFIFCLFLAVLLLPAESKPKKDKDKHRGHGHRHRHGHRHGHGHGQSMRERKKLKFKDIIEDVFFEIIDVGGDDDDDDDDKNPDWVLELQDPDGQCSPNPCMNNGVCKEKKKGKFKCDCPKPFKGRRCERGPKHCRRGRCGRGECVLTSTPPYYECKCKYPFQPPDCRTAEVCEPNPCKNGGQCIKDGNDFDCQCPVGFRGHFCQIGPDDCYLDDGESYRGNVSETEDGDECLYWNSHFTLQNGIDPFSHFEDTEGLGRHNFCRNPDGDKMPWCFFRRRHKLLWAYCDVTECPDPTGVTPTTDDVTPETKPTSDLPPLPPTTVQPTAGKPSQTPQPSPTPTDVPVTPNATVTPPEFLTCGIPQPRKAITRIYGGLKVPPGSIPWQVSLQVRPRGSVQSYRHVCGGVLIASCWVLTAGHCIEGNKDMQVVMGSQSLDMLDIDAQTVEVEQAIVHENYRETPSAVYNDIALLRLKGTNGVCAEESQFVKTACLPNGELPDGMECTISGWGGTEQSDYGSNHLLEANVLLINQEKCSEPTIYGSVLDQTMLCAGHLQGGVDSCQGDSGGPLTCSQNSTNVVYGLVSWGDQCGKKNKPGVYTRVTNYLDWIKSKTQLTFP